MATLIATGGIHALHVQWDDGATAATTAAAQGAEGGYLLQRRSAQSGWQDLAVLPPGTTEFTDTQFADNTAYSYRVQRLDPSSNDSDFTTTLESVLTPPAAPPTPQLTSVTTLAADRLQIAWAAPATAVADYRLERSADGGQSFTLVAQTTGQTTSFTDSGLAPGTTYSYRISAQNQGGISAQSNVLNGATRQRAPRAAACPCRTAAGRSCPGELGCWPGRCNGGYRSQPAWVCRLRPDRWS